MKIYTKIEEKYRGNIYEYLKAGFTHPGQGVLKFVETYQDEECTITECHPARRSFEDLIEICKTAFPECTEKDVACVIMEMGKDPKNFVSTFFCPDIHKPVFFINLGSRHYFPYLNSRTGDRSKRGNSKYCLLDVYKLAGVNYDTNKPIICNALLVLPKMEIEEKKYVKQMAMEFQNFDVDI